MIFLKRTDSKNEVFIKLVAALDAGLEEIDGEDHSFYDQFNKLHNINHAIVAYANEIPVGCGAIKSFDEQTMEVKRMFVYPEARGKGIATKILEALENWASELGYSTCVLETGIRQEEAMALYQKNGYDIIPNYGQYVGVKNSICFLKQI